MDLTKIGAHAVIQWIGQKEAQKAYISYGEWDETTDTDGFGVDDSQIFYYARPSEMESLKEYELNRGWHIIKYSEEKEVSA
jgi:hypothetical protein